MRLLRPLTAAAAVSFALGAAAFATPATEIDDKTRPRPLTLTAELERPILAKGFDEALYLMVDLEAPALIRPREERPRINLALVLDRSGSMQDKGKITYLREAANFGVDLLGEDDRLALIEYDDAVTVMRPLSPVNDKAAIKAEIKKLTPRGSTNLTGGMLAGVEQLSGPARRSTDSASVTRVLLLSDGLANAGIVDDDQIRARVKAAKQAGVRITTLGLGRDYDEDLMQMIAEQGGGAYYYIEHPRQMVRIFEEEMSSLFATVATGVTLAFEKSDAVQSVDLVSVTEAYGDNAAAIPMADFYAGETRRLVFRLTLKEPVSDASLKLALGQLTLSATDVDSGQSHSETLPLSADTTLSVATADKARNKEVAVEAALLKAEQDNKAALAAYEKGDHAGADEIIVTAQKRLSSDSFVASDDRIAQKREALKVEAEDMQTYAAAPAQSAAYLKRSKQRLYKAQKGDRKGFVMQQGASGIEVERLQQTLKDEGFYKGAVDGEFDAETETALKAYQADQGLDADGVAGPATLKGLGLY